MKVLVIGSGGREHALVKKIAESSRVTDLYVAPGNHGIAKDAECIDIKETDINKLADLAIQKDIDLTIVGPEQPLSQGIVDHFQSKGLNIFGPSQKAAKIETSKWFAKQLMQTYGIPTGKAEYIEGDAGLDNLEKGLSALEDMSPPFVVKADGLYAGKGVIVTEEISEAEQAVENFLSEHTSILIEEYLEGEELSLLAFSDGHKVLPLIPSQDYKRAYDNDQGPNTGGMGSYAPVPSISQEQLEWIVDNIMQPTITALKKQGVTYQGILYAGLILTDSGPKVLEFNARFGDPETQAILPLLKTDILEPIMGVVAGNLETELKEPLKDALSWKAEKAVCVVLASGGYPKEYQKGFPIKIPQELLTWNNVNLYYAGVASENGTPVTAGGRVLNVTGIGESWKEARENAYEGVSTVEFDGKHFRNDIALQTLK
ncbi:phosphoribosylamine--glycine ligase [Natranaerobius thermophilus]|uniref:Phosphoribosylamine--glycine ligase n=1 Tax=Natranaerobius thermophilus (strain ATCC BAA-1301 / DSM 18059 / JW/NM-WN-LF) TaxID=457570 RepID=B2A5W2_NATTJ|nr:phosphoribosylamine--glycine ligase [Natranaerobius thermophilus]ACB84055.1 phosphoribosylamine--glycine ligase [Natranaerobius thermophilus JW/NM-WN-LF]